MKETTTNPASPVASAPGAPAKPRRPKGQGPPHDLGEGASPEARRTAAAILEVLAGARSPTEAAQALGLSLPRYYLLEVRALHGMLGACEPRRIGRVATPESALAALQRECEQLRRECARQQALVRAAQRTIGLTPPAPPRAKAGANGRPRRRRRPVARALRAAARLKETPAVPPPPSAAKDQP